ncbi:MAG: hypothetical protein IT450_11880 [Phycisphaerales bacterium]|nr:hypothetical protein [Phycisphaerales bacterium]
MNDRWTPGGRAILRDAAALAKKSGRAAVDVGHLLVALSRDSGMGGFAFAAFGVSRVALREAVAAAQAAAPVVGSPELPEPLALPITPALEAVLRASNAFVNAHNFYCVDAQTLLYFSVREDDSPGAALLRQLNVDLDGLRAENNVTDVAAIMRHGTPRLSEYAERKARTLTGRLIRIYQRFRPPLRVVRPGPLDPRTVFSALTNRAMLSDADEFRIHEHEFDDWLPAETQNARRYDRRRVFKAMLDSIPAGSQGMRSTGSTFVPNKPGVYVFGTVTATRDGDVIVVRVIERRAPRLGPAPQESPLLLIGELVDGPASRRWHASITRATLTQNLSEQTRAHPEFNADRAYDAILQQLDEPLSPTLGRGLIRIRGRRLFWVYTDGERILLSRWLAPWTKRRIRKTGRY